MKKLILITILTAALLFSVCEAAKYKITPQEEYVEKLNRYSYDNSCDYGATVDGKKCDTIVIAFRNFSLEKATKFVKKMKKTFKAKGFICAAVTGANEKNHYIKL